MPAFTKNEMRATTVGKSSSGTLVRASSSTAIAVARANAEEPHEEEIDPEAEDVEPRPRGEYKPEIPDDVLTQIISWEELDWDIDPYIVYMLSNFLVLRDKIFYWRHKTNGPMDGKTNWKRYRWI